MAILSLFPKREANLPYICGILQQTNNTVDDIEDCINKIDKLLTESPSVLSEEATGEEIKKILSSIKEAMHNNLS